MLYYLIPKKKVICQLSVSTDNNIGFCACVDASYKLTNKNMISRIERNVASPERNVNYIES